MTADWDGLKDRKDLENRLVAALKSDISRDAKDYVCRKLTIVGTAALYGGITELPPGILREGIPGFHYPAEDE
jgi:hypothetical protein